MWTPKSDHTEKNQLLKPFFKKLTSDEKAPGWFQQDGATCHTANSTKEVLEEVFNTRLISKPKWPARSPDMTPPDFFLWGMLKGRVYEKNPSDLSALKPKTKREIAKVTEAQLSDVFENLKKRVHMCEKWQTFSTSYVTRLISILLLCLLFLFRVFIYL